MFHAKFSQKYPVLLERTLFLLFVLFLVMAAILDIRLTQFYNSMTLVMIHVTLESGQAPSENCRPSGFIEDV